MPGSVATFLMTDVEGSTRIWERERDPMSRAVAQLDAIVESEIERAGGTLVKARGEGDSHFAVFESVSGALDAACAIQLGINRTTFPTAAPISVRVAIHTGEVESRAADFYGPTINRCARLRSIGHGGQILLSQAASQLVRAELKDGVKLVDLGQHRLKDLLEPERVYQASHPRLRRQFEPLRSLRSDTTNLPIQLTSFVGREAEILDVCDLVSRSRVVTLVGPGGCGKTRLSLQVAAEMTDQFEDGVWFIPLAPVTDATAIPDLIATQLQVPPSATESAMDRVCGHLSARRALVIFDNCEHLGEAPARVVSELISKCPGVSVLSTSRKGLGLTAEVLHRVPPLETPEEGSRLPVSDLQQVESVRLLVDRAKAKAPTFAFKESNSDGVAKLCIALDGMPLAIELAAPQLRVLSPEGILKKLKVGIGLLSSTELDADPRHRTLQSAIEWSYGLLGEDARGSLSRLSVFPAGFCLEAAESVVGDGALGVLTELVDNSLVQVYQLEDGEPRYRILETIRQFALSGIATDELEAANEQLFDWALAFAVRSKPELAGARQEEWLARVQTEYENLRLALAWCERAQPSRLVELASNLDRFWHRKGLLREGRTWLELAVQNAQGGDPKSVALTTRSAGVFANLQGDRETAVGHLAASSIRLERLGETNELAGALTNMAMVQAELGKFSDARSSFKKAISIYRDQGDRAREALALQNIASLELDQKRAKQARDLLLRAHALLSELDDRWGLAMVDSNLGSAYIDLRRFAEAAGHLRCALRTWIDLQAWQSAFSSLRHLAELAVLTEHHELAISLVCGARELSVRTNAVAREHDSEHIAQLAAMASSHLPEDEPSRAAAKFHLMNPEEIAAYAIGAVDIICETGGISS